MRSADKIRIRYQTGVQEDYAEGTRTRMKRWLVALGLFIVLGITLAASWLGFYLVIKSLAEFIIALLLVAALAIWLSGPMSRVWDRD